MMPFEEVVRLAIKDEFSAKSASLLSDRIFLAIERKKRFYVLIKLVVYGLITVVSSVGLVVIWKTEGSNIINSQEANLLVLLFSDFTLVATYWQEYALSLVESFPVVSVIAVAAFAWVVCASLWMTIRTYLSFIHRTVKHI